MPFLPAAAAASLPPDMSGTSLLTVVGLGLLAAWAVSLLLHPYTACSSCKGTPRSYGAIATRSFRLCPSCGGTGRQLRVGARIWPQNRG
jgi:hypothetical protein